MMHVAAVRIRSRAEQGAGNWLRRAAAVARDIMEAALQRHFADLGFQQSVLGWPRLKSDREWRRIQSGQRRAMLVDTGNLMGKARVVVKMERDAAAIMYRDDAGYGKYHVATRNPYLLTSQEADELRKLVGSLRWG
jgi:hypothetical protein